MVPIQRSQFLAPSFFGHAPDAPDLHPEPVFWLLVFCHAPDLRPVPIPTASIARRKHFTRVLKER
jgi:hypothetical protein